MLIELECLQRGVRFRIEAMMTVILKATLPPNFNPSVLTLTRTPDPNNRKQQDARCMRGASVESNMGMPTRKGWGEDIGYYFCFRDCTPTPTPNC